MGFLALGEGEGVRGGRGMGRAVTFGMKVVEYGVLYMPLEPPWRLVYN